MEGGRGEGWREGGGGMEGGGGGEGERGREGPINLAACKHFSLSACIGTT